MSRAPTQIFVCGGGGQGRVGKTFLLNPPILVTLHCFTVRVAGWVWDDGGQNCCFQKKNITGFTLLRWLFIRVQPKIHPLFCRFLEISSSRHRRVGAQKILNALQSFVQTPMKILNSSPLWTLMQHIFKWGKVLNVQCKL